MQVLRDAERADGGSCGAAVQGREVGLGEPGDRLQQVQRQEGQQEPQAAGVDPEAETQGALRTSTAQPAHPSLMLAYDSSQVTQRCWHSCARSGESEGILTNAAVVQEPSPYQMGILLGIETEFAKPPKVCAEDCMLPVLSQSLPICKLCGAC